MAGFLDLLDVIDPDGTSPTKYRLHYLGSSVIHQDSWIFGMLTELVYVVFQMMAVPANALLGAVLNSSQWLGALGEFYRKLTAPVFAVFPPWAITCLGLALVAFSALRERPGRGDTSWSKSFDMGSDTLNRVGGAIAMAAMVVVLTNNPFALVSKLLDLANGFSAGLASEVARGGTDTALVSGQVLVDSAIRTPTIALNFGGDLSAACRTQWSQAMAEGRALDDGSGCYAAGANEAGPGTLSTAALMLFLPALPMLAFCAIAAWKYFVHLTLSVMCLLATGYVAAVNVHRRRGFEKLTEIFAKSVAHLAIAVVISMLTLALPATVAGLGSQLIARLGANPGAQPYALMVSLGVGFAVSIWAIMQLVSTHGLLVRLFHADANVTMKKVFGTDTRRVTERVSSRTKIVDGWKKERQSAVSALGKTALAEDPVEATRGARKARGAGTAPGRDNSVTQLMAAARSVAEDSVAPDSSSADASIPPPAAGGGATALAAGIAGQVIRVTTGPVALASSPAGQTAPSPAISPIVDNYSYFFEGLTPAASGSGAFTGQGDSGAPDASTAPGTGGDRGSSPLADPARPPLSPDGTPPPPVTGLLPGADPALETAARQTGRPVVVSSMPEPQRARSPLLRQFRRLPTILRSRGSVPEVQYGPPLVSIAETSAAPVAGGDTPATGPDANNEQQRWNRRKRPGFRGGVWGVIETPATTGAVSESATDSGPLTHPGSFQAPQADFLAGDDLVCQIEEIRTIAAAAGTAVDIQIGLEDRRLGLRFSSDPDERIRPSNPPGFGDHE